MAAHVRGSRAVALSAAKTLIPTSVLGLRALVYGARLISALPPGPSRALLRLTTKSGRFYNCMNVDDCPPLPAASAGPVDVASDPEAASGTGPTSHE